MAKRLDIGNNKEQPIDDETKTWSGVTEIYTIIEGTDNNTLTVEIDILNKHLDFMTNTLPKALEIVKRLSENQ